MTSPIPESRVKGAAVLGDTTNTPPRPSSKHQKCQFEGCTKFARRGGDNKFCTKHLPKHLKRWCVICKHHLAQYAGSRCSKCAGKKRSNSSVNPIGRLHQVRSAGIVGGHNIFGDDAQLELNDAPFTTEDNFNTLLREKPSSFNVKEDNGELEQFESGTAVCARTDKMEPDQAASNSDLMEALDFLISISDEECERILGSRSESTGKGPSVDYLPEQPDKTLFPIPDKSQSSMNHNFAMNSSDSFEVGMLFDGGATLLLTA